MGLISASADAFIFISFSSLFGRAFKSSGALHKDVATSFSRHFSINFQQLSVLFAMMHRSSSEH